MQRQVSAAIGVPAGRVQLIMAGLDLMSGDFDSSATLRSVLDLNGRSTDEGTSIQVIVMKCSVRPDLYERCIKQTDYAFESVGVIDDFPTPTGLNINMMPFKISDESTLPASCSQYWALIEACIDTAPQVAEDEIWYLTVEEGDVPAGESQRRPGLHVECPGMLYDGGLNELLSWGLGSQRSGGIFMISNWSGTCRVWPCHVSGEAIGHLGDIEHLREHLPEGRDLGAREIGWITDTTPHEALPVSEAGYRQFFRLVASEVSVWYSKHSTPNPLGITPDPSRTKIVDDDKFAS